MKEENNDVAKNKWRQIFRKKWFFPAMYLTIAALLLTVVVWYQNSDKQVSEPVDEENISESVNDESVPVNQDEDVESVLDQQEVIKMPIQNEDQAEIVTKFYDYNASDEDQEKGLIHIKDGYEQSKGLNIASEDGETFDVQASLSGTVTEVKEDPLLGNVVTLAHQNGVVTYYASLGAVNVDSGSKVEQGEKIGTAGKSLKGKDFGTHVHFQVRKDGQPVNPESYINQPVSKLDDVSVADEDEDDEDSEEGTTEDDDEDDEDVEQDQSEESNSAVPTAE